MSSNKFLPGFLLGAAAGAALIYFLKSEKGQEVISNLKENAEDIQDNIQKNFKASVQKMDDGVNDLLTKGKSFIDDLEQNAKNAIS